MEDDAADRLSLPDLLRLAETTWRKAQVLRTVRPRGGESAAVQLSERLSKRGAEAEEALFQMLDHESALVCAYALWTLFRMESPVFGRLPEELLKRKDSVTEICGSFSHRHDLGGWAAHLRKRSGRRR